MTNILVVGGAGYIGSHTCLDLANKGFTPVVYDNLSNGHAEFVKWGPLERGDIRDRARLDAVFEAYKPVAIVHFAALIEVGESVRNPTGFFENNVAGTLTLLSAAQAAGIDKLVFSSTCATYGLPQAIPMDETHPPGADQPLRAQQAHRRADACAISTATRISVRWCCAISMPPAPTPKGASANGIRRKRTPFRWRSRQHLAGVRISRCSATTTTRETAPASAISST